MQKITSHSNPIIKNLLKLQKASERKNQNLFIIEGFREIRQALHSDYEITSLFVCPDIADKDKMKELAGYSIKNSIEIGASVFKQVAYRENTDGLIATAIPKSLMLKDLKLSSNPLIIVLESVEKPGNLGAIMRTAEAAKVDAIIINDSQTELHNPNIIRSSLGCFFALQTVVCPVEDAIGWLKEKGINTYAAALSATKFYYECDYSQPAALVMGSEAQGLSEKWLKICDDRIKIPMLGKHDSLNVSVSSAILIYEVLRQRGFKKEPV